MNIFCLDSLRSFSYLRSFTTILDSCLGRSSADRPNICDQPLFLPFRSDQPIEYEPIQWQTEPSSTSRFVVQPPSPSRVLQPRHEPNNDTQANNTNIILLDDNDEQNYVDANGDEENEAPKVTKKKGKKKKQQAKVVEQNDETSMQLNTSSNRTSTTGQKPQVKSFVRIGYGTFIGDFLAKIIIEMVNWKTYIRIWYWENQCYS